MGLGFKIMLLYPNLLIHVYNKPSLRKAHGISLFLNRIFLIFTILTSGNEICHYIRYS